MLFENNIIKIDKVPNVLDDLVLEFTGILSKHYGYVIISGYVAILLGRARATEDIDILIEKKNGKVFSKFWKSIIKNKFYCLNTENLDEAWSYLEEGLAIRFAKGSIFIPEIEQQIAVKRILLASRKDIEDAIHLEELFKEKLNNKKLLQYTELCKRIKNQP